MWREDANRLILQHPTEGGESILRRLEAWVDKPEQAALKQGIQQNRFSLPDARTLARWKEGHKGLSEEEKQAYLPYKWPNSHDEFLAVPWEAAAVGAAIVQSRRSAGTGRPSIRQIRWAWKIARSAPDMPVVGRPGWMDDAIYKNAVALAPPGPLGGHELHWNVETISGLLAASYGKTFMWAPSVGPAEQLSLEEVIEDYIASAPWRSPEHAATYLFDNVLRWRGPLMMLYWELSADAQPDQTAMLGAVSIQYEGSLVIEWEPHETQTEERSDG